MESVFQVESRSISFWKYPNQEISNCPEHLFSPSGFKQRFNVDDHIFCCGPLSGIFPVRRIMDFYIPWAGPASSLNRYQWICLVPTLLLTSYVMLCRSLNPPGAGKMLLSSFPGFLLYSVDKRFHVPHPAQGSQSMVRDGLRQRAVIETFHLTCCTKSSAIPVSLKFTRQVLRPCLSLWGKPEHSMPSFATAEILAITKLLCNERH